MISVREDEFAAQAMGVNVARVKVLAFMMAAFFAGHGRRACSPTKAATIISPQDAGFQRSLDYVIMTVLGGRGSITGVMLAAIDSHRAARIAARLRAVSADRVRLAADRHDAAAAAGTVRHPRNLGFLAARLRRDVTVAGERRDDFASHRINSSLARRRQPSADRAVARRRRHRHFVRRLEGRAEIFGQAAAGALYGLIGPNGAGKTTVFNLLTGVYRTGGGRMQLGFAEPRRPEAAQIAAAGIARTFQNIRLFPGLERARQRAAGRPVASTATGWPDTLLRTRQYRSEEAEISIARRSSCLGLFDLQDRAYEPADSPELRPSAASGNRPRAGGRAKGAAAR